MSSISNVADGAAILSSDGSVEGLYSAANNQIIPADAIQSALNSYFANNNKIVRNLAGFNYEYIPKSLAAIGSQSEGVILRANGKTLAVLPASPAQKAGLQDGDIITAVDNTQINFDNSLEELLGRHKPGDSVSLSVLRAKNKLNLNLVLGSR